MNSTIHGFSLVEVLVAAFVLAVALTASAALFSNSVMTNAGNRYRAVAATLVQDKMEELRHRKTLDVGSYSEMLTVPVAGTRREFLRLWRVEAGPPHRVTVIVLGHRYGTYGPLEDLARAATIVSGGY